MAHEALQSVEDGGAALTLNRPDRRNTMNTALLTALRSGFDKLTGQPIDARRAWRIGMVHQAAPAAALERSTYALARVIADNAPLALAGLKATILRAISARETMAHEDLDDLAARARRSADAREGRRTMLEKRRPAFGGE